MAPTLVPGDHVFANKLRRSPAPGDLVVYAFPKQPSVKFIKRVVAVGGDRVQVKDGTLLVNGAAIPAREVPCPPLVDDPSAPCAEETLGSARYTVAARRRDHLLPPSEEITLAPGAVYVLGDNRDDSHDSRFWGPVPAEHVLGTVSILWWPSAEGGLRWSRFGTTPR